MSAKIKTELKIQIQLLEGLTYAGFRPLKDHFYQ